MSRKDIVDRVQARMTRERLSQRNVARRSGISQGHLSKLLQRKETPGAQALRRLAAWLGDTGGGDFDLAPELARAVRRAVGDSKAAMHFVLKVMHLLTALRRAEVEPTTNDTRRRGRGE